MPILTCIQELRSYHELLPQLSERQPGHHTVLRGLALHCGRCLDTLAKLPLSSAQVHTLAYSRQLCHQATDEARRTPMRWHVLYTYLDQALAAWKLSTT